MDEPAHSRWIELVKPDYVFTTITLCLGVALLAFNVFLVSTSMPTAIVELDGAALIAWSVSLYLIFAIVGGTASALLKGQFGARAVLCAAAVLFMSGSALAGAAPAMWVLLVGRVLQGTGEGIIAAVCYALIPEMLPKRLVPKIFGAEAVVWAVAAFGGPVLAGWLTEAISWRAAFLFNVPASLVFVALALWVVPRGEGHPPQGETFPFARLATIALGMLLVTFAGAGLGVGLAAAMVAVAVVLLVLATVTDRKARVRFFPPDAFHFASPIGLGLWVAMLMPMAYAATTVYLVYGLQHLWGFRPTFAGAIAAITAVCWSLTAVAVANVEARGLRLGFIWFGPLMLILGLAAITSGLWSGILAFLLAGLVLCGSAFGLSWGYLSQTMMETAPDAERNRTSALLPTVQSAGFAMGASAMGIVANWAGFAEARLEADLRHALVVVFMAEAGLAVLALAAAARAVPLFSRR